MAYGYHDHPNEMAEKVQLLCHMGTKAFALPLQKKKNCTAYDLAKHDSTNKLSD